MALSARRGAKSCKSFYVTSCCAFLDAWVDMGLQTHNYSGPPLLDTSFRSLYLLVTRMYWQGHVRGARWCAPTPRSGDARGPSRCSRWRHSAAAAGASFLGYCWRRRRKRINPGLSGSAWTRRYRQVAWRCASSLRRAQAFPTADAAALCWGWCWRRECSCEVPRLTHSAWVLCAVSKDGQIYTFAAVEVVMVALP